MATKPATKPAPEPKPDPDPEPEAPAKAEPTLRPDGPTIAELQRESSAQIEAMGMKAYQDSVDQRTPEERTARQVPGVVPPTKRG